MESSVNQLFRIWGEKVYFIVNWQYNLIRTAVFNSNSVDYLIHFHTINKGDVPRYPPQVCLCHCNIHEIFTKTNFWYCIEFHVRKNFIEKMPKILLILFSLFQNRKKTTKQPLATRNKYRNTFRIFFISINSP